MTRASVVRKGQQDRPGSDQVHESPSGLGNSAGQERTDSAKFVQEDGLESIKQIFDNQMDQLWKNTKFDPACTILTLPEVAALCRTGLRTIQDAARNGQLPARKIGRVWRCRLDEILDWLRGPQRVPSPEREMPVSHPRQLQNISLPSWDWSNRNLNLGFELETESSYCRKHGKVPDGSSSKGDFDER